jgi:hypothetical protein
LLSFDSYGIAPGALRQKGAALGPQTFGAKRLPMSSGPLPTGGLAVFRISLVSVSGASKTAVLQINCALGNAPRDRSVEGIRLAFEKNPPEFSEEAGGRVMFLSTHARANMADKLGENSKLPDSADLPKN